MAVVASTYNAQDTRAKDPLFVVKVQQAIVTAAIQIQAEANPTPIVSNTLANPTVIATAAAHGRTTGDVVQIAGNVGSVPSINGAFPVTVIDATHFSIPVNCTTGGTGGSMTPTAAHHSERSALAAQVLAAPSTWAALMAQGVTSNAAITDASLDSDIQFQVNAQWNAYCVRG
jgi:hypothetical protein